jgi:hypothetical protein
MKVNSVLLLGRNLLIAANAPVPVEHCTCQHSKDVSIAPHRLPPGLGIRPERKFAGGIWGAELPARRLYGYNATAMRNGCIFFE